MSFMKGIFVSCSMLLLGLMLPAVAADPFPLQFSYAGSSKDAQQAEWDYLMKYKMYGSEGITFEGTNIKVPDEVGWFGTSRGNFLLKNGIHDVGGPIIIGGNVQFMSGDGNEHFTTGPIRVSGSVSTDNWNAGSLIKGPVCVQNDVSAKFSGSVTGDKYFGTAYGNCPLTVPEVKTNLSIPTISTSALNAMESHASIYRDNQTEYLDVPAGDGMYDVRVPSIELRNNSSLIIRMPKGGRLTRIFVSGDLKIDSKARIQVQYKNTDGSYSDIANEDYAGNLLFYVTSDITWDARGNDIPLQGTFISTGQIHVKQQLTLAGQLLAKTLLIDANFDGSGFIYVPFDPPEIDIQALVKGKYPENDKDTVIDIHLNKIPETDVKIEYCFEFRSGARMASQDDITIAGHVEDKTQRNYFPICGSNPEIGPRKEIFIPMGSLAPTDSNKMAWLNVKTDNLMEQDEFLKFHVIKIAGAVIKGDVREGAVDLTLADMNNEPPSLLSNNSLAVKENDTKAIVGQIAGIIKASDPEGSVLSFEILGGTGKDYFELNSISDNSVQVVLKDGVVFDFEDSDLQGKGAVLTLNVNVYDQYNLSDVKLYEIPVLDVNEKPIILPQDFTVKEDVTNKTIAQVKWDDTDKFDTTGGLKLGIHSKHNLCEMVDGDVDVFDVNGACFVSVKNADLIDYEADSVLSVKVRVRDTSAYEVTLTGERNYYLWDTAWVNFHVQDVDDIPKIIETDTTKEVPPGDGDTDGNKFDNLVTKGNVDENNPEGATAGAVIATCSDSLKTLYYEIVKDTSGLFQIDPLTGVVSVKDSMVLDYERVNEYYIDVKVSDGIVKADGKDENGVIVQSAVKTNVLIKVNDVNESPLVEKQSFTVKENTGKGASVGTVVSDDIDKSAKFTKHEYSAVGGDTDLFNIDTKGNITTKENLDYEKYEDNNVFKLVVKVKDVMPGPHKEELFVVDTMTITLLNENEQPRIVPITPSVDENTKGGVVIDSLKATDPDKDDEQRFDLVEVSDYVTLDSNGTIRVKDGANIDYEVIQEIAIKVSVTDKGGLSDTSIVRIRVRDVNEPPTVADTTFYINENQKGEVGKVKGKDPDTKNPSYGTLKYTQLTDSKEIKIHEDGTVEVIKRLDYEVDSVYKVKVRVDDGQYADTAYVTVRVNNVQEPTEVQFTCAENRDSLWSYPELLYVNDYDMHYCLSIDNNKPVEGDTTLKEGRNEIIKCFIGEKADTEGCDTLIVIVSTKSPIVTVSKAVEEVDDPNIFTVVEEPVPGDTSFYVNKEKNDIFVTVKDPESGETESFTIKLKLDTLKVPAKVFSTMSGIEQSIQPLNEKAKDKKYTPVGDEKVAVSYVEKVDGEPVTVTYYTDRKGNILENADGSVEMTVSYETVVDGDSVTISFKANAETGYAIVNKETGGVYSVQYSYTDEKKNTIDIAYTVDSKGKIVKGISDDVDYTVGYTYVNKYGNSATKSISVVLDKKPPLVWIKYPVEDDIIYSNTVDVEWYVSLSGDSTDFVLQDTLVTQGLEKGSMGIKRFYCDKANNCVSDNVTVLVKNAKDVDISIVTPVTTVTRQKTEEYYSVNPPKKGETFAVSIKNPKTNEEFETLIGGDFKTTAGSGETPYPGFEGHLGPTLEIETRVPTVNDTKGLATLDDIIGKDGLVNIDGVDAKNGRKNTVDEYVDTYCLAEFRDSLKADYSRVNLYNTTMIVKVWVFTTLGSFVDYFTFSQELNDPDYVNEGGKLNMFFELKPKEDGYVRTENGRLYASGAYLFKTEVEMRSTLQCTLPPVLDDTKESNTMGFKRKVTEDLLKPFGYRRPTDKTDK